MKTTVFTLIFSMTFLCSYSQMETKGTVMSYSGDGSMVFIQVPEKKVETEGSVYLEDSWNAGVINLYSETSIKNYPFKVNVKTNDIEIKTEDDVRVLPSSEVKFFIWRSQSGGKEIYMNTQEFEGATHSGFYKVLSHGDVSLLRRTKLLLMHSNYNAAVDAGRESQKYVKEYDYFVHVGGSTKQIKANRRSMLKFFDDKAEKVKQFAKQNRLKFNNENDLAKIFDFYNSI